MANFMDPIQLLNSMPSLYITAYMALGSLSLCGLSIGFLWNSCGYQAIRSMKGWLAKKTRCHSQCSTLWDCLNKGVWG